MKKALVALLAFALIASAMTGCSQSLSGEDAEESPSPSPETQEEGSASEAALAAATLSIDEYITLCEPDADDTKTDYDSASATIITLSGTTAQIEGEGAEAADGLVKITAAGTYVLSGNFTGQIKVDAGSSDLVRLIFAGVSITNPSGACVYAKQAEKTVITLADGTENALADGETYTFSDGDEDPDATLYAQDDLTINGAGALTVTASYQDGIVSKDTLKLVGGKITVNAADDGINGRDALALCGAELSITAAGDGLKSTYDKDTEKGVVLISSGSAVITCGSDGIQSENTAAVTGGTLTITAGGGSAQAEQRDAFADFHGNATNSGTTETDPSSDENSTKGIKAVSLLVISGGDITIDSTDDSLHTNGSMEITDGTLTLSSGDDGAHADGSFIISGGAINVATSYEGLEGENITISGGDIKIASTDDGLNATDGSGQDAGNSMMGGSTSTDMTIAISGGSLYVNAAGDGIDSNGDIVISGGTIIVDGPANGANGALDCGTTITLTGGELVAVGASQMAEYPDGEDQPFLSVWFDSDMPAGTVLTVCDETGAELLTFTSAKSFGHAVLSCPEMTAGASCTLKVDGEDYASFTLVAGVNTSGTAVGMSGGNMGQGGNGGGRGQGNFNGTSDSDNATTPIASPGGADSGSGATMPEGGKQRPDGSAGGPQAPSASAQPDDSN